MSGICEQNQVKLTPLQSTKSLKENGKGFWTFDVETKDGLRGTQLFCWGLAYKDSGGIYRYIKGFEQLDKLFEKFKYRHIHVV
ncbi:MAG: hypothetical protein R6U52_05995 [Kosmotogaceae bacterium]